MSEKVLSILSNGGGSEAPLGEKEPYKTRNLSKEKRERMLSFLDKIREQHKDDDKTLIAINEIENELINKKYGLVWEEHSEEVEEKLVNNIPVFTEDKSREIVIDPSLPYNFLIEGDNLHALKLLEKTHKGKIDVIYIDPPYNTENEDFIYNDNMIVKEDTFRHSKWLSFMNRRLKIAYNLLSSRGVIFISIDDNEISTLKMLCDEIFNAKNFVTQLVWEKKKKGSFLSNQITNIKEYVLVYCKDMNNFAGLIGEINAETETYPCVNASNKRSVCKVSKGINSNYREKNYVVPAGTVISDSTMDIKYITDLVIEDGIVTQDFEVEGNWRYKRDEMYKYSLNQEVYITNALYIRRIVSTPRYKTMKDLLTRVGDDENTTYNTPININNLFDSGWGSNEDADNELINFFGTKRIFSYPKPVRLIKKLICSTRIANATVLDFFAGSGTTAQAVMELNAEDGGNRKFILCTNNEGNTCENITYPRISKVVNGYSFTNKKEDVIFEKKFSLKDLRKAENILNDADKIADANQARFKKITKSFKGNTFKIVGELNTISRVEGIPANLKYFKTDFVSRDSETLSDDLLEHIKEMVELENACKIDGSKIIILLSDKDADDLENDWQNKKDNLQILYVSKNVLFSTKQKQLFKEVEQHIIPDRYFDFELKEEGETW